MLQRYFVVTEQQHDQATPLSEQVEQNLSKSWQAFRRLPCCRRSREVRLRR